MRHKLNTNWLLIKISINWSSISVTNWMLIGISIWHQSCINRHINLASIMHQSAYQPGINYVSIRCPIDVGFWRKSTTNRAAWLMLNWNNQIPIWHQSGNWLVTDLWPICHYSTCVKTALSDLLLYAPKNWQQKAANRTKISKNRMVYLQIGNPIFGRFLLIRLVK